MKHYLGKYLVCFALLLFVGISFTHSTEAKASTVYQAGQVRKDTRFYKKASSSSSTLMKAKKGTKVVVISDKRVSSNGTTWYRIVFKNNKGKRKTGYVVTKYLLRKEGTSTDKIEYDGTLKSTANLRKIASDLSGRVCKIGSGKEVKIMARLSFFGQVWYKCSYQDKVGYLSNKEVSTVDIVFEESIKTFPVDYRQSIRALHAKYPKWRFKAVNTELDFNTVVKNESKAGLCNIQSGYPKGVAFNAPFSYLSTEKGCYNWATDKYTVFDGTNWYSADSNVIAYYLDPRNFLTEKGIFQFRSFKYEGGERKSVVKNILKGTFMSGNYTYRYKGKKYTRSYASSFMTAGKLAGISPYFLASKSRNEMGTEGTELSFGSYPGYKGYYNYYNIGANDSKEGLARLNGVVFAKKADTTYMKPWNTPYKAIRGGAIYLANGYIPVKQFTVYFQKFNVVNTTTASLYNHQFMSNVQAPTSEGNTLFNTFSKLGCVSDKFTFYIPVYNNMPENPRSLPAIAGNPNNYLKKLSIADSAGNAINFNETFGYTTQNYTANINSATGEFYFDVAATKISSYATITSGTGRVNINIAPGKTATLSVVCQAGNGNKRTYKITLTNTFGM